MTSVTRATRGHDVSRYSASGQQNATPRAKKRNPGKKFVEGTASMVRGCRNELFSGLRSITRVHFCMCFHHTNFVCGSAIQVGIVIAVHCIYCIQYPIYRCLCTVESACASSCGVWLAQWSVRMNAHRARAGSSPRAVHDRHFSCLY